MVVRYVSCCTGYYKSQAKLTSVNIFECVGTAQRAVNIHFNDVNNLFV
jgi:hypothetical protein